MVFQSLLYIYLIVFFSNLLVIPSRSNHFSGIELTTSSEIAERQIQTTEISTFKIHENISVIHQNKAELLVNSAAVSNFKKAKADHATF